MPNEMLEGIDRRTLFVSDIFIVCKKDFDYWESSTAFYKLVTEKFKVKNKRKHYRTNGEMNVFYDKNYNKEETIERTKLKFKELLDSHKNNSKIISINKDTFNFNGNCPVN